MLVYLKMLSEAAKLSGMFCPITSTSMEKEEVKFLMEIAAIPGAISGFPK